MDAGDQAAPPPGRHVLVTPAGALRAAGGDRGEVRSLLRALLRAPTTVGTSSGELAAAFPDRPRGVLEASLRGLEQVGLVSFATQPYKLGAHKLEDGLPQLLHRLSTVGRGLLADGRGFCVSSTGFALDEALSLAVLACEISTIDSHWRDRSGAEPAMEPPCWRSAVGAQGEILSFRLLSIGPHRFVLVLVGDENLADPALVWLVWSLSHRYDDGPLFDEAPEHAAHRR